MKFTHKGIEYEVDNEIHLRQGINPDELILECDFHALGCTVKAPFIYNGASSPNGPIMRWIAPKYYRNIKASCLHDWLCSKAKTDEERASADMAYYLMKKYVEKDTSIKSELSFLGVRLGAFFGVGSSFK